MCIRGKINLFLMLFTCLLLIGCAGNSETDQLAKELAIVNCDLTHHEERLTETEFGSDEYDQLIEGLEILREERNFLLDKINERYNTDEEFDQFYQIYQQKHKEYCQ